MDGVKENIPSDFKDCPDNKLPESTREALKRAFEPTAKGLDEYPTIPSPRGVKGPDYKAIANQMWGVMHTRFRDGGPISERDIKFFLPIFEPRTIVNTLIESLRDPDEILEERFRGNDVAKQFADRRIKDGRDHV